jgi:ribosome-associated protein
MAGALTALKQAEPLLPDADPTLKLIANLLRGELESAQKDRQMQAALERPRTRRATRPTKGSQQRRLSNKRHRGELKRERGSAAE